MDAGRAPSNWEGTVPLKFDTGGDFRGENWGQAFAIQSGQPTDEGAG